MPRQKQQGQILNAAHEYIQQYAPELQDTPLVLRVLDGPANAPHFSATAEKCGAHVCPYGVSPEIAACGKCPISECSLRCSVRLLLDRSGAVIQVLRGSTHWS